MRTPDRHRESLARAYGPADVGDFHVAEVFAARAAQLGKGGGLDDGGDFMLP